MSMLPSGPGVVSWSMMKALKRDDVLVDKKQYATKAMKPLL